MLGNSSFYVLLLSSIEFFFNLETITTCHKNLTALLMTMEISSLTLLGLYLDSCKNQEPEYILLL
jgi:hypothetical protein